MQLFRTIKNWLGKDTTLPMLSIASLHADQLALDNESRRLRLEVDQLEAEKKALINEYEQASLNGHIGHARFLAQEYEALKSKMTGLNLRHQLLCKQMRMIQGLIKLKETSARQHDRNSVLAMDLAQLLQRVECEISRGELNLEQVDNLLNTMADADARACLVRDASLLDAVEELDAAVQARAELRGESNEALAGALAKLEAELGSIRQGQVVQEGVQP
ncbi:hypothetical protein [Chitinilyticum aquatile]|uniref:hypothetical protein n=1 Tax=Chitinilyticum aquatile TaxID=362520 RepID=UPI00048A6A88|nr:hypothetical protein [Chitinilyticum aquatile]